MITAEEANKVAGVDFNPTLDDIPDERRKALERGLDKFIKAAARRGRQTTTITPMDLGTFMADDAVAIKECVVILKDNGYKVRTRKFAYDSTAIEVSWAGVGITATKTKKGIRRLFG